MQGDRNILGHVEVNDASHGINSTSFPYQSLYEAPGLELTAEDRTCVVTIYFAVFISIGATLINA